MRSAFNASRGFYLQLYASSSDNEAPGPPVKTISKMEQLPKEFLKVTKHRGTFSFTTLDLIKLNSKDVLHIMCSVHAQARGYVISQVHLYIYRVSNN